jgi:hypothetical protein
MKFRSVAVSAVVASLACASAVAFEKPGFPRLGGIKISSPMDYQESAYADELGKLDVVVINTFPGWSNGRGMTMQQAVEGIKRRNPKMLVLAYVNVNERTNVSGTVWEPVRTKLHAEKWWLYPTALSGLPVISTWDAKFGITNYSNTARRSAAGERYNEWFPRWAHKNLLAPVPAFDGTFTDNFFWKPRVDGDWNVDGSIDRSGDATAQRLHREGMRRHVEVLKGLMPGKYHVGNIGGWGENGANLTEYQGLLNGGGLERYLGHTISPEGQDWKGVLNSWGSWSEMMARYRKIMRAVAEPKLVIFMHYGTRTDYKTFRYGLTSVMMDDGYYDFADQQYGYARVPHFDEYSVDLGQAVSAPPTTAWKSGVYRRDFQNGIALVNPRGNGPVTVELEKEFRRIKGTQAPDVNNGQTTRSVTLKDRDGIILLSTTTTKQPEPPTNVTIE